MNSNIKTTVDFYLHTSIATMQSIFERVDNAMPIVGIDKKHNIIPVSLQNNI